MSSYSCVVPVNWTLLWDDVLPAWLSVLSGKLTPATFYAQYVPKGDTYGDLLDEMYSAPAEYLSLFPTVLQPPYTRAALFDTDKCTEFLRTVDSSANPYLLEAAIKQTTVINLPGDDLYSDNYYGTLSTPTNDKQVAGTKNFFDFLESAFELHWHAETRNYTYTCRQGGASTQLQNLLAQLFLYQHVLPGTWLPDASHFWPGYDDLSFAGYLAPEHVKSLHVELSNWNSPTLKNDELFPLFFDRVTRTAKVGGGLLTIHAGL